MVLHWQVYLDVYLALDLALIEHLSQTYNLTLGYHFDTDLVTSLHLLSHPHSNSKLDLTSLLAHGVCCDRP